MAATDNPLQVTATLEALLDSWEATNSAKIRSHVMARGRDQRFRFMVQTVAVACVWRMVACPTTG